MPDLEIEIKYEIKGFDGLKLSQATLLASGIEKNSFMDIGSILAKKSKRFRIREYNNEVLLTIKGKNLSSDDIKHVPEKNAVMGCSYNEALKFFEELGYREIAFYEKFTRNTYRLNDCIVCADMIIDQEKRQPRYFVEIEGPSNERILANARIIDINNPGLEARVIKESYFKMFARPRK